jgi:hypothetical protein
MAMANLPEQTDPPGDPTEFRAGDADRDRVAEVLRQAAGDGRLTLDELDERLNRTFAARTYAELALVTRDLPQVSSAPSAAVDPRAAGRRPTSRFAIAIMSGFSRAGHWVVGRNFTAFALMGGGQLDLREAAFAKGQVTIRAFALMGGIEILVPEDAELHVLGIPVMGGVDHPRIRPSPPGAPRVYVFALTLMGGVGVKYKAPRGDSTRKVKDKPSGDDSGRKQLPPE